MNSKHRTGRSGDPKPGMTIPPFPAPAALPVWSIIAPALGIATQALTHQTDASWWSLPLAAIVLTITVLAAVHHAEVVAHRVGEPFGSLVLALAVTTIETALIVALMLAGGESAAGLARDTVFAAIMIVCNGVVGICVFAGSLRHRVVQFSTDGTSSALAVLVALATLSFVLPAFTKSTPGPTLAPSQLIFAGLVSTLLYCAFVFVQTIRHRSYFLPAEGPDDDEHFAAPPTTRTAVISLGLLMASLIGVVGLTKSLAPSVERVVTQLGAPRAVVGVLVALLVLAPETLAAIRAAMRNRLQTSLNLALGSGLASIGLTIPMVAFFSVYLGSTVKLGLEPVEIVLLILTFIVAVLTLGHGRATILQGLVHLVLFMVYLFMTIVP